MIEINKRLQKDFDDYCKLNEVENVSQILFVKCAKDGLTLG